MKNISISRATFEKLRPLSLSKEVIFTESKVYDFNYYGNSKILKVLNASFGLPFANKLYTVEMLNSNKEYLPNSFVIPDATVSVKNQIIGFTVPKVDGVPLSILLTDKTIYCKEKISYLKRVGDILNHLSYIRKYTPLDSIYINDLNPSNIIVNPKNKEQYIIDLDSCKIGKNESFPARFMTVNSLLNNVPKKYNINNNEYSLGHVVADENSDLYCYNIMILNYLYGSNVNNFTLDEFYQYLDYLKSLKVNKELLNSFYGLLTQKPNINPAYYLESLTEKQIGCANKKVYNLNKH